MVTCIPVLTRVPPGHWSSSCAHCPGLWRSFVLSELLHNIVRWSPGNKFTAAARLSRHVARLPPQLGFCPKACFWSPGLSPLTIPRFISSPLSLFCFTGFLNSIKLRFWLENKIHKCWFYRRSTSGVQRKTIYFKIKFSLRKPHLTSQFSQEHILLMSFDKKLRMFITRPGWSGLTWQTDKPHRGPAAEKASPQPTPGHSALFRLWISSKFKFKLDRGSIRSSLRDSLTTPYRLTKEHCWTVLWCHFPHSSCTEFVSCMLAFWKLCNK